jgi:hypothetical protein
MLVWVTNIFFLSLVVGAVWRYLVPRVWTAWFWTALAASVLCGILLGLYYDHAGGGDTFFYYQQGSILAGQLRAHPHESLTLLFGGAPNLDGFSLGNEPRSLFFVRLVALLQWCTGGGYWIIAVYFSVINFLASWYLFNAIATRYRDAVVPAAVAFLFFPSVVFWGSGLLKESIAMGALFVLLGLYIQSWNGSLASAVARVVLFLVCAYVLWRLRYFYAAVLIPVFVAAVLGKWLVATMHTGVSANRLWYPVFFVLLLALLYLASQLHYNLRWQNLPAVLYNNYIEFAAASQAGRYIQYKHIAPDFPGVLRSIPKAMFSTLFRPNIWDYAHPSQIPLSVENFVLLCSTIVLLLNRRTWHQLSRREVFASVLFIVLTAAMLGLASPNYGSLARYRIGVLSLTVFLVGIGLRDICFRKVDPRAAK